MRRWTSIFLALAMLLALVPTNIFAAENDKTVFSDMKDSDYYAQAATALEQLDIISGYPDGTFRAESSITRAEMATIVCRIIDKENDAEKAYGETIFEDVKSDHWASGYINVAVEEEIVNGDGNGKFRPEDEVKYEEAIKMIVCALGYAEDIDVDPEDWAKAYLDVANEEGITSDLEGEEGEAATRGDIAVMVYNGLATESENSKVPATPVASLKAGEYSGTQKVKLTTVTKDSDIYYTTDGTTPTAKSTKYVKEISISQTSILKAVAVKNGVVSKNIMSVEYTIKKASSGGGGGGGGGGSSKNPELIVYDFVEDESNNIDSETVDISGTAKAFSGKISTVTYSLKFTLEETASVSGVAEGTTNWEIKNLPLKVGTSFLNITATDTKGKTVSKEIVLNRLSTEIELSENVVLYTEEQTNIIADDIIDYWVDDMGTVDDTYDDQTNVLFKESSEIVQSIKSGLIEVGDVLMLQPCESLYLGFNGVFVSNKEHEDVEKYPISEYEVLTFTSADYTDLFISDVSLSYELADTENPIAFAYFPSEVEICAIDDYGNEQATLYSNVNEEISLLATEGIGDQSVEQEIKDVGFQKNALSYMMSDALNVTGGLSSDNGMNIGIKFKDTILFDADGSKDTTNDQFKFGGSILYNNFKVKAGIEWHPNFNPFNLDLLPQQVMGKYSYTEKINARADWTGKLSLNDIKDSAGNKVGLVKAANKLLNNNFENNKQFMGMTLSGVDMSDSIILGAFGLQISPAGVAPVVGIKNAQYSSIFTPLSAILVIMPVVNVNGEISAKIGFTYEYSAYNEKGINMQKKDYVGSFGSLNENKGQTSIDLPFDRSLEIYNVCSKSSADRFSDPTWNITLKGEGEAEEKIAIGADIGLMIAGIMPTSAEVKIYENAKADISGQINADNENGLSLEGAASVDAKIGVMAGVHFKLAASTALFSPEIRGDKEWDKILLGIGITSASIGGIVLKNDTDNDDSNNEKVKDVSVTLKRTDKLGEPTQIVTTDNDGKYNIDNVLEGTYKLSFSKDEFDVYETDEFSMTGSDKIINAYLVPSNHSKLSGKVTEADYDTDTTNNLPLSDVQVSASMSNGAKNVYKVTTTSNDGTYSISDLPVGLYDVTFSKDGYISTTQTFEIAEGVENYYNTIIESISNEHDGTGTASGIISDYLTGQGVERLTLNIRSGVGTKNGDIIDTILSEANGKYITPELTAGLYTVEIVDNRDDISEKYLTNYFNIKIMGDTNIGNQNGAVGTGLVGDQLRIVLRWGATPSDLDSHLIGPKSNGGKFHTYYLSSNRAYYENDIKIADLDLDDVDSWGPETTTIYNPIPGIYKFCVHDFSNRYYEDNTELANSGAVVQIYRGISAVPEYELYVPQGVGTVWNVFEYDSETGNINIINTITHQSLPSNVGLMVSSDDVELFGIDDEKISDEKVSDIKADDIEVSDTKADDVEVPNTEADGAEVTDTKEGDTEVPDAEVDDTEVSDEEEKEDTVVSDIEVPDAKADDVEIPDAETGDIKVPDIKADDTEVPDAEASDDNELSYDENVIISDITEKEQ